VVSRASDAIAGDIERGTILFVLSRPVSRGALLLGKTAEIVLSLGLVVAGSVGGTALGITLVDLGEAINLWPFVLIGLNAYALFLALAGVTLIISALSNSAAAVAGWATAFALLAFTADFLAGLPVINLLGILSPFRFYDPQTIVASGNLPLVNTFVLLLTFLVGFIVAGLLFQRRDIIG
jgi:ABC-2 type transport system permease protein